MKYFFFVATFFYTTAGFSQTTIKLEDAAKHIGDSVSVCGKVAGGAFIEQIDNSPTFLVLGAPYPDQLLTLVIWKDQRPTYNPAPETFYVDKEVCITGKIALGQERPQIIIYKKDQIKVTTK